MTYRIPTADSSATANPAGEAAAPAGELSRQGGLPPPDAVLERLALRLLQERLGIRLSGGSTAEILVDGEAAFPAMLEAIGKARERILFETYIYRHDKVGVEFYTALLEKLRAGVQVYLLYDDFAASEAEELFEDLAAHGAHICAVNPVRRFETIKAWHRRDHRKILVVDGDMAFTGGINIGTEYVEPGPDRPFRDTHLRIRGPLARRLEHAFRELWEGQTGEKLPGTHHSATHAGEMRGLVLWETYRKEKRANRALHRIAFAHAKRRIWITNAYFVPHARLRKSLLAARRRGVDVRILLPGPTDVRVVKWASRALYPALLRGGIRIFEYKPRVLHAKSIVIDDTWGMVGSTNLDTRSFRHNLEIQCLLMDEGFTADLAALFEKDLAQAAEITLEDWKRRPFLEKLWYRLFHQFQNLL